MTIWTFEQLARGWTDFAVMCYDMKPMTAANRYRLAQRFRAFARRRLKSGQEPKAVFHELMDMAEKEYLTYHRQRNRYGNI